MSPYKFFHGEVLLHLERMFNQVNLGEENKHEQKRVKKIFFRSPDYQKERCERGENHGVRDEGQPHEKACQQVFFARFSQIQVESQQSEIQGEVNEFSFQEQGVSS